MKLLLPHFLFPTHMQRFQALHHIRMIFKQIFSLGHVCVHMSFGSAFGPVIGVPEDWIEDDDIVDTNFNGIITWEETNWYQQRFGDCWLREDFFNPDGNKGKKAIVG